MLRDIQRPPVRRFRKQLIGASILIVAGLIASVPATTSGFHELRRLSDRAAATLQAVTNPPDKNQVTSTDALTRMMRFRRASFAARPEPVPSPEPVAVVAAAPAPAAPAPPAPAGSVAAIITAAAEEFGVDPNFLLNLARCESGLNPRAYNPAGYYGLFQYSQGTWASNGYGSIYDPVAQSRTTARMISQGGAGHWAGCL